MAGSRLYTSSYKRSDAELLEPGYLKASLNIVDDFATLQEPPPLDQNSVTGDNNIITSAHIWKSGKKPMGIWVNNKILEAPGETVGDPGSLKMKWTPKIFIKGDGPVTQDFVESLLNEDLVIFLTDGCPDAEILQFGCDCKPGEVQKATFASATLASGAKGYSFEVDFYCRFFYRGGAIVTRP